MRLPSPLPQDVVAAFFRAFSGQEITTSAAAAILAERLGMSVTSSRLYEWRSGARKLPSNVGREMALYAAPIIFKGVLSKAQSKSVARALSAPPITGGGGRP